MADDYFAQGRLQQECWDERLRRIAKETRECILATRELIARSRESLALVHERIKRRQRPLLPR